MVVQPQQVLEAGDVALVVNDWTMAGTAPDGTPVVRDGRSADVLRRQPDGSWKVLIDRP
jgi:ketosteroid isomerase-like protein